MNFAFFLEEAGPGLAQLEAESRAPWPVRVESGLKRGGRKVGYGYL